MQTYNLVKEAIKHKAPALHKQLEAKGELNKYARDLAEQIQQEIVDLTMADHKRNRWDKLEPMERAAKMKTAMSLNQEKVLADMLEFPQEETSLQSQD